MELELAKSMFNQVIQRWPGVYKIERAPNGIWDWNTVEDWEREHWLKLANDNDIPHWYKNES